MYLIAMLPSCNYCTHYYYFYYRDHHIPRACAYGIEPLVDKLVQCGANVNACNSFGYSCMLEACHRGYIVVARSLLKGPVDLSYIPREEESLNSPFASAPCQSALAEAARCGFFKVVQVLRMRCSSCSC